LNKMNTLYSEKNKNMQSLLKKATFEDGIKELIFLREMLMNEILSWKERLSAEEFYAIPFIDADGYHSKTVAYSVWHIMRIEDIVVNTLILDKDEVLFRDGFDKKTKSPIVTTGNELVKNEIAEFSRKLDINALFEYAAAVKESTEGWLYTLRYDEAKRKFTDCDKERIRSLNVVSDSEKASWLIDYWCGKDIIGLIKMPLSRHWIMHIEAADRIINKIK